MTRTALVRIDRYAWGAIWLHWSIATLVLVNLALGLLHDLLFDGIEWVLPLHRSIGIAVLALVVLRIAAALRPSSCCAMPLLGRMAPGLIRNG